MELLHNLVWDIRKTEEEHNEVRLDALVIIEVFDECGSVLDHCIHIIQFLNVIKIRKWIVPWSALDDFFLDFGLVQFGDYFRILDLNTIPLLDVCIFTDYLVGVEKLQDFVEVGQILVNGQFTIRK